MLSIFTILHRQASLLGTTISKCKFQNQVTNIETEALSSHKAMALTPRAVLNCGNVFEAYSLLMLGRAQDPNISSLEFFSDIDINSE